MTVVRWVATRVRAMPGALWYLGMGAITSLVSIFAVVGLLIIGAACLVGVGIPVMPEAVKVVRPLVRLDRWRAGKYLGREIPVPYQPLEGGWREQWATLVRDPANRRDLGWLAWNAAVGLVLGVLAVALPISAVVKIVGPWSWRLLPGGSVDDLEIVVDSWGMAAVSSTTGLFVLWLALQAPVVARWQARIVAALLGPAKGLELAHRVAALTATRAAALDAHGAELRRIERDLHDGAQARIAAVIMQLGVADQLRQRDPAAADELVRKAQDTATAALSELREVVRSVYPPVLSDRGLASAISALAARSPIPCTVDLGRGAQPPSSEDTAPGPHAADAFPRRPAAVEAAAYFVIAEALTNATKHSRAQHVSVSLGGTTELLTVEIRDDGVGEARDIEGGGLAGIRRRAEALDGRMLLSSPAGGPTVVRVELPCGS
ncbi:sensor domain-containing protein [Nocardia sp. NBC_01503]|uniref:sensor histidine kinase n=1 Tax=Nocardia sp. NBC_01503 TaxID=2975997 RepID=UPI002E7B583F|nr:sensor domain-containing protein [Nocardia sp. NBC_01503]WTL34578.1 sensor domain-containing protein [Nocardia sp. NBC_01503]